jgi:hypothetical protein
MKDIKEILTRKGNGRRKVVLPNTSIQVFVRELSAAETRDFGEKAKIANKETDPDGNIDLLADAVILGVVDEHGNQIFNADDRDAIKSGMSIGTMRFISTEIGRLSGGEPDDQKKDGGSLQPTLNSDSPSNSAAS